MFAAITARLRRRAALSLAVGTALALTLAACGSGGSAGGSTTSSGAPSTGGNTQSVASGFVLRVGAIPDQDPEKLARQFGAVSAYLSQATGAKVTYVPVADYAAAVTGFKVGDLDLVWFGGLTGVQARSMVPDAVYVAQRDVDATFQSVFVAGAAAGIAPFDSVEGLRALKGRSVSFGSESSTSGRLMPQYFLRRAGVAASDLKGGQPGFSGSHDQTIRVVESGTFEVGALNKKVWDKAVVDGTVDTTKVSVVFTTPPYFDYHWLARPDLDARAGAPLTDAVARALLALDRDVPAEAELLSLFGGGAGAFIATEAANYTQIEDIARELGLLTT